MDVDKMRTSVRHEGEGDVVIKEEIFERRRGNLIEL